MFRVDLHVHTTFSGDSTITPKTVVEKLNAHPTVKGAAITDHDTTEGYFKVHRLADAYTDLVIIPGIEVRTERGDIIILGVDEEPEQPNTLRSTLNFAAETHGVVLIPHPYRSPGIGDFALNMRSDAIEVFNPTATPKENMMAQRLAEAGQLPRVAGTDAHSADEMGIAFTEVEAQPNAESILEAIRNVLVKPVYSEKQSLRWHDFL